MRPTRPHFDQLVRRYQPMPWETFPANDPRFRIPMHYVLKNRDRLRVAIHSALRYFPARSFTVVDLGTYPGSLLRLLCQSLPAGRCRLIGAGLAVTPDFAEMMHHDCGAEILTVNLDPSNPQLRSKGYPNQIPLPDSSVDFVFALEIIEHLVSPTHLLHEAARILIPGGHLLLTTPNVSRIGNIFKLLIGSSNFDRLRPVDYDDPNDEWRPHFREYALAELCSFVEQAGFTIRERRYFQNNDTQHNLKSPAQKCIDLLKLPFGAFPHLRGDLLVVGSRA